jgi:hypothetical protein
MKNFDPVACGGADPVEYVYFVSGIDERRPSALDRSESGFGPYDREPS